VKGVPVRRPRGYEECMDTRREPSAALLLGPLAAILIAGVLTAARSAFGTTNVALLLVLVVVATAAVSDRRATVVTAVVAALAYNFFHTRPYDTLRVDDRVDLTTIGLLVVVGLVAAELNARRRRRAAQVSTLADDLEHWRQLASVAAAGDFDATTEAATAMLTTVMHLQACRFEPAARTTAGLVPLRRDGSLDSVTLHWAPEGFELPLEGVAVPVMRGRAVVGQLVLVPGADPGASLEHRRLAVAVGDLLAASSASFART